ncbi:MAG: major capsid protein [Microvirus sp.]|nr:MAG: major capsid protein [Microvirus sp.]
MFRNQSVNVHQFSMIPRADIPRSSFNIQKAHKTTFDAGLLIPVYCSEILPGDTFNLSMTAFARLATPIFPIMDNMSLSSFFFFVPNRLVWQHWVNFQGEQKNPGDSVSYTIPQTVCPVGGYAAGSIFDHFGLPTAGQVGAGNVVSHSSLPLRCYNKIWYDWFKDENLQNAPLLFDGDADDPTAGFALLRRGKRKDYFTGCLPWPQKSNTPVSLPLGGTAPIIGSGSPIQVHDNLGSGARNLIMSNAGTSPIDYAGTTLAAASPAFLAEPSGMVADLSAATAATINQLRQAVQIQRLLERDARGGTRYVESILARFGVQNPDFRLQRSEYLGGSSSPVNINPIAQTSGSPGTGGYTATPMGTLAAVGTILAQGHGFSQSFTEHGYVIGLVCVDADLTYQQGLERFWSRKTRYDFYEPVFCMLGEQAVLSKEIYCDGSLQDEDVFGYQERWAEYRYAPSQITGLFRSTDPTPLDAWHLAQRFVSRPVLDSTFIQSNPPVDRVIAVTSPGYQFIFDSFFNIQAARPMPMFSVPGMMDHF